MPVTELRAKLRSLKAKKEIHFDFTKEAFLVQIERTTNTVERHAIVEELCSEVKRLEQIRVQKVDDVGCLRRFFAQNFLLILDISRKTDLPSILADLINDFLRNPPETRRRRLGRRTRPRRPRKRCQQGRRFLEAVFGNLLFCRGRGRATRRSTKEGFSMGLCRPDFDREAKARVGRSLRESVHP